MIFQVDITPKAPYPVLYYENEIARYRLLCENEIGLITGFCKTGKTRLISLITGAFLNEQKASINAGFIAIHRKDKPRVVCFDGENNQLLELKQSISNRAKVDINSGELSYYDINRFRSPNERLDLIQEVLKDGDVGLVVIESITDLVKTIGSVREANNLIKCLRTWARGAAIVCSIHKNEGIGKRNGARGEIGKILEKESAFTACISKEKENFNLDFVKLNHSRWLPDVRKLQWSDKLNGLE